VSTERGRRRTFMLGIAVFTAASLAVGLAQSPAWMIAARAAQGIGAAMLGPSTLALLSASFPEGPQRTRAMAAYGALPGIGTAFGLIVGGVLTSALSWRYGFFLNVPVGLAAILAAPRVLKETERHAARLDVPGAPSSTLGASALVFGIVQFLFNAVLVSFFCFMTQYLQGVSGDTPLQAGVAFLPVTAAAFAAAAVTSPRGGARRQRRARRRRLRGHAHRSSRCR
jgi:MFS family permease